MSVMEILEMIHTIIPYEVKMIVYVGTVMYLYLYFKERKNRAKQESKNQAND